MTEGIVSNIRELLGWAIGQRIVDITQQDQSEYEENGASYIMIMLENGGLLRFNFTDTSIEWHDGK